ncbi:hypothetical protein [Streptomyces sioyaensis]|nr:hypothetical protein [Streptomyces sioyaensis]
MAIGCLGKEARTVVRTSLTMIVPSEVEESGSGDCRRAHHSAGP